MKPEISIVIPAFNEEASIRETLDALRNFGNVEIILVDGGSTDGATTDSKDVVARLVVSPFRASTHERLQPLSVGEEPGPL